jgi:thioredoxin-like negative regulator of GroEL
MKNLIIYSASYCNPCKQLKKTTDNINLGIPVNIIDIEDDPVSASEYAIRGVPTLLLMDDMQVVKRHTGSMTAKQLEEFCA